MELKRKIKIKWYIDEMFKVSWKFKLLPGKIPESLFSLGLLAAKFPWTWHNRILHPNGLRRSVDLGQQGNSLPSFTTVGGAAQVLPVSVTPAPYMGDLISPRF